MPEPIQPAESLQPQRLTVGETPVYLKKPLEIDGKQVTELTIKGESARRKDGIDSSVLLLKDQSRRRGEEGQVFVKPLTNVSAMEEVDWDKVGGIQYTMPDGSVHTITKDQLSLTQPDFSPSLPLSPTPDLPISPSPALPLSPTPSREPALARSILETYSGEPTTLTIVGLKAYETRAHDLADKAMQLKTSLGERIWKQGIGPAYFHEQARQYYDAMLKAAQSPFAEQSIKIAEAAGKNRYQDLLSNKNFLTRPTRQFIEWMKDSVGAQTLVQKFALEEIAHMRETGEIKERETFNREAASIRKRFEQDMNNQDAFIRKSLGENIVLLDRPEHQPMVDEIKQLVKDYATGTGSIATKKDFDTATDKLFQKYLKGEHRDIFDQTELYTASLYDVAENLRTRAAHEGGIEAINARLKTMEVRLGMGVMGEATALVPSDVEKGTKAVIKAVEWMEKKGIIGPFAFNEATVSSAVALSLSLSILPRMGLSTIANGVFSLGGGAAVGGIFAGLREYRNLEKEYLTHIREREAGLTFSPDAKRRAWMETFMVGQRSADDLIAQIRTPIYESDGKTLRTTISEDELRGSLAHLADAKARRALSGRTDSQRVGLIQFTGRDNIETQRTALDVTIAQAEKDLLSLSSTHPITPSFIADLTAAQTRILTDGISRVQGLDDPIKVTLGLLDTYNPEADIMRRRFPLIGPDQKTGAKAQGLEEIFKEFRRAAAGEAVKKGLQVGLSSAIIGGVLRGVLEGGAQIGAEALKHTPPPGSPESWFAPHDFQFSGNLHIDQTTGNLLDAQNKIIIGGLKNALADPTKNYLLNGELTPAGKQFILEQAQLNHVNLEIPDAVKSTWNFTNDRLVPLSGLKPGVDIQAPPELHWTAAADGTKRLVIDIKDANGAIASQDVVWNSATDAGSPIDAVTRHVPLHYSPEQNISTSVATERIFLPGVAPFPDAQGAIHNIQAMIPKGTMLTETGTLPNGEHVYQLVDSHKTTLLGNIHVDQYGQITNLDDLNASADAATHHIEFTNPLDSTLKIPIGGSGGGMEKIVGDMGNEKGAHGIWGWVEDPMIASGDVKSITPATNLAKNLFRGYEENVVMKANFILENGTKGGDIPYTAMHPGDKFIDLPKALFEDAQLVKLGKLMDEAIQIREVDGKALADMDDLHRTVYEIGRIGRVATKDEVEFMIRELGGGEKTVSIFTPVIKQSVVQTIPGQITGTNTSIVTNIINLAERTATPDLSWIPPIPLIHRRPLEPFVPLEPYTPPEASPGELFPLLPKPSTVDNPSPFLSIWDPYGGRPEAYGSHKGSESQKYTQEEIINYYRSRTHPDLVADPKARPNFETATAWYLKQLEPRYRKALENINKTIAQPMHNDTQVAVCIPVRASQEGKHIYHTLEQYAKQTDLEGKPFDKSKYEIVLFLNAPDKEPLDNTMDEVKRFMTEHPDMPVRVATGKFPKGAVRYGTYIKYAYDLALLRAMERTNPSQKELLIATGDADLTHMEPNYLASNIAFMNDQNNAHLDATLAAQDLEAPALNAYPTFKAALRFSQYQEAQVRQGVPGWNTSASTGPSFPYVQTQGRTTVLRGSTLAAIGGVNDSSPAGADIELGRMINFARHGRFANISADEQTIAYNPDTNIQTNARRELVTYLSGQPITHTWSKFDEGEEVRNKSTQELIAMSEEKPGTINVRELERQINAFREWDVHMNSYYTTQALSWMGLKEGTDYVIEDDLAEAHKGGQWQKKVIFTSDLSALSSRIKDLPSEPAKLQTPNEEAQVESVIPTQLVPATTPGKTTSSAATPTQPTQQ